MRYRSLWLCAAATLTLGACDRSKGAAERAAPGVKAAARPAVAKPAAAIPAATTPSAAPQIQETAATNARRSGAVGASGAPARARKASLASAKPGRASSVRTQAGRGVTASNGGPLLREASYSAEYKACVAKANGLTVERADCHSAELARQGQRLTQAYDAAAANRRAGGRERLEATQRDWANERDAACRAQARRGDADLLQEGSCRLDMTIRRANGLVREAG